MQKKTNKIYFLTKGRFGPYGTEMNCIEFCENFGFICIADKSGKINILLLPRIRLLKKLDLGASIKSLKYIERHSLLFFCFDNTEIGYLNFKTKKIKRHELGFVGNCIEYIDQLDLFAFAGENHGIHCFNKDFQRIFAIYYDDYECYITKMIYIKQMQTIISCLDNGIFVAFDVKSKKIMHRDLHNKSVTRYFCNIDKEGFLFAATGGKIYLRTFDINSGFMTKTFTWMREKQLLSSILLREGKYLACLHEQEPTIDIVRVRDWQITAKIPIFQNFSGGTNLTNLGKSNVMIVSEKSEGLYYLLKY